MSDDQIPIDPKRGLDPRLCYCTRCGNDTGSLSVGDVRKAELDNGQVVYASRGKGQKNVSAQLKRQGYIKRLSWQRLDDNEKVPDTGFCESCRKELEEWAELVKEGGVYFRCGECKANGVIHPHTEVSETIRKHMGIEPPKPCGVEFQRCEQHERLVENG